MREWPAALKKQFMARRCILRSAVGLSVLVNRISGSAVSVFWSIGTMEPLVLSEKCLIRMVFVGIVVDSMAFSRSCAGLQAANRSNSLS